MTIARKNVVLANEDGIYHCISRCVRAGFLCGYNAETDTDYSYRKSWILERLVFLIQIFTLEVITYAVMDNHVHLLLKTHIFKVDELSDEEVVYRWRRLYPTRATRGLNGEKAKELAYQQMIADKRKVQLWRERLGNISWFNKCLNEYIARKANKEDKCTGHFWDGRFKCQLVDDIDAVLKCATYIDLNLIRAKMASTPETSENTGAYDRIKAQNATNQLTKIYAEEGTDLSTYNTELQAIVSQLKREQKQDKWLSQTVFNTNNQQGLLNLTFSEYLEILDWTGQQVHTGKRGVIPSNIKPIIERLKLKEETWLENFSARKFHKVISSADRLKYYAGKFNQKWLRGKKAAEMYF